MTTPPHPSFAPYAIVAGFGLAGRVIVEHLDRAGVPHAIVDRNPHTVQRCAKARIEIIEGDIADEGILRRAGIERATLLAITMPDEASGKQAVIVAHRLNPRCRILVRTQYTSSGLALLQSGAAEAVVAEQTVAYEFARLVARELAPDDAPVTLR